MRRGCNIHSVLTSLFVITIFSGVSAPEEPVTTAEFVLHSGPRVAESGQSLSAIQVGDSQNQTTHFCGTDLTSPAARAAHDRYHTARKNGTLRRARKFSSPPDIGDQSTFRIIDQLGTENQAWIEKTFRLVDREPDAYLIWVDLEELSQLTANELSSIRTALLESTPAGSVDPSQGILVNNETYFGDPPDYDGDHHTDILFYDIGGPNSLILGFVTSADIDPLAPDSVGNQADVLYLDSRAGIGSLAPVAAHEYTHLLNLAAGFDLNYTFISEGLAEYAIVMNGYSTWRRISYLGVLYLEQPVPNRFEYTRPLFNWRTDQLGGQDPLLYDYQRGNFFFGYMGDHFGPGAIGRMLQAELKGPQGIDSILVVENSSFRELLPDFHTANYINDQSIDPRYGHPIPGRPLSLTMPTRQYDGEKTLNGPEGPEFITILDDQRVHGGSAHYVRWINVSDFVLNFDIFGAGAFPQEVVDFQRSNMVARVIGERENGTLEFFDFTPQEDAIRFDGRFPSLTLLVTHIDPAIGTGGRYSLYASWVPLSLATDMETEIQIPATLSLGQNFPNPFSSETTISFELNRPAHTRISVYDVLGRLITHLVDGPLQPGIHRHVFDASHLSSGIYFYRIEVDGFVQSRTMQLVR